jgi:uncharacterized protein (DUF2235 family)
VESVPPGGYDVGRLYHALSGMRLPMAKNIVICSDGTGQTDDGVYPSNVARLCSLLDLKNRERQICCYDPGVGTVPGPEVSPLISPVDRWMEPHQRGYAALVPRRARTVAGLAVGYGLKKNVEDLYSYLAENFADGDRVYLFGFSRGAFTVRVVAGLLSRCGLLLPRNLKEFQEAFNLYKPHYETYGNNPAGLNELKQRIVKFKADYARPGQCSIHFLGVWDTVKSYGYLRPRSLPNTRHNRLVSTVRHALSIDERRSFFALTTWGGRDLDQEEGCLPQDGQPEPQDVKEVWFAGDHSDVGGGHKDGAVGLAKISLKWMVKEAASFCLRVDNDKYREMFKDSNSDHCKRHDEAHRWTWRLLENVPRRDLKNCPLPPRLEWAWKSAGPRTIGESRRNGDVLIHESAKTFYTDEERHHLWGNLQVVSVGTDENVDTQARVECD